MQRRFFLTSAAAICAFPISATAYSPTLYSPATWRDVIEQNPRVVLNFHASWSLTCQIKEDLLTSLLQENPQYRALKFVKVDWDTFGPSQWTERLKVKRNSTLLVMDGRKEVSRIVNEPNERSMRRFLDRALES